MADTDRDALAEARLIAGMHATGAVARGDLDERRRWLDMVILLDRTQEQFARLIAEAEARGAARVHDLLRQHMSPSGVHHAIEWADLRAALVSEAGDHQ
jgi:hypothetical protein